MLSENDIRLDQTDRYIQQDGWTEIDQMRSNPFIWKTMEQLYVAQKTWILAYIQSDMYKQNLKKELLLLKDSNYIWKNKKQLMEKNMDGYVEKIISERINRINEWEVQFTKKLFLKWWSYKNKKIKIAYEALQSQQYLVPIHELAHLSTDAEYAMIETSFRKLQKSTQVMSPYLQRPTEIHARITAMKYLAHALGLYNAFIQEFTQEVLDKLKSSTIAMQDKNLADLLDRIYPGQEETLIELSNFLADLTHPQNDNTFGNAT